MTLIRPWALLLLLPWALLSWTWLRQQLLQQTWEKVCDTHLIKYLHFIGKDQNQQRLVACFSLLGLLAIIALAGPSMRQLPQPLFANNAARVLVMNLSPSMLAADLKPNRMRRTQYKVMDFLNSGSEGQNALVVFAGEPFVVSPLTEDAKTIANMVPVLQPGLLPVQGYDLASALKQAEKLLQQAGSKVGEIIVISDHAEQAAIDYAKKLKRNNISVHALAIGTNAGAPIPLPEGGFVQQGGKPVLAKLDYASLSQLTQAGGGKLVKLSVKDDDVQALLNARHVNPNDLRKTQQQAMLWEDQGFWLVLCLLPLMLVAFRRGYL